MLFNNTNMRTAMAYTNAVGDKVYPVIVDIKKGIKSTEEILFVSSDINTGVLSVAFIQGNDTYNVEGAEVICSIMRPDTTTLEIPCNAVNDNIVEVPLGVNGTSQDGVYSFDFKVFKGEDKIVGTPIMNYSVSLSISNDLVVEEDDRLPVLTMLITQVNELKEETRETVNQANTATEATKEATAKAIEATNNANAVSERVSQETSEAISRVDNTIVELNNTVSEKVSELDNAKSDMTTTVSNKVNEVETRFNALTSSQQQDAEVIDARDGETSLKARLDRDIEKAKQVYVNVEGSNISTDSSSGYLKDVEILGNTIQDASNLADIRSVGDTVEGQELYEIPVLSCGKNLFNGKWEIGGIVDANGSDYVVNTNLRSCYIKVKPNTSYRLSNGTVNSYRIYYYTSDKEYIKYNVQNSVNVGGFTTPETAKYVRIQVVNNTTVNNLQLEEGTVATPFEPYQEDKITILSPTQLEKVGDVADRIVCKDGVWGVEKNVKSKILDGSEGWVQNNVGECYLKPFDVLAGSKLICDILPNDTTQEYYIKVHTYNQEISIKNEASIISSSEFKQYLSKNNILVKYPTTQPQFIPLPHDQQVKLRTFANKINISFLTEIEGTIKAQVPKSLGATVNTHTTQISNLNKELDRVKKLEESTVSTVTTESDFTTVEATSNGYFEDVKLEGKTLVNLCDKVAYIAGNSQSSIVRDDDNNCTNVTITSEGSSVLCYDINSQLKSSTTYTAICQVKTDYLHPIEGYKVAISFRNVSGTDFGLSLKTFATADFSSQFVSVITTIQTDANSEVSKLVIGNHGIQGVGKTLSVKNVILLEGDHTQNPPSYFEGLKSVGDTTDEIVVSSVNENLFDTDGLTYGRVGSLVIGKHYNEVYLKSNNAQNRVIGLPVRLPQNSNLKFYFKCEGYQLAHAFFDENLRFVRDSSWHPNAIEISPRGGEVYLGSYIRRDDNAVMSKSDIEYIKQNATIIASNNFESIVYTPHQSDKKRLLFYNNETQTWEKPVLRKWDSIEKHSDGKYYYHQRSGEVVLNGENGSINKGSDLDSTCYFEINDINLKASLLKPTSNTLIANILCDKLNINSIQNLYATQDTEGIGISTSGLIGVRINKSKLSTQDVQGFKQWLQANNVTVVYQLAQEKVYECTNIDLITYANETNYIVEGGAIVPKTILKVHNNISNVVKILQEKVSLLENKFIEGLKQVLAGDMYSLAELLYPEDFTEETSENGIMLIPLE